MTESPETAAPETTEVNDIETLPQAINYLSGMVFDLRAIRDFLRKVSGDLGAYRYDPDERDCECWPASR